MKTILITIFIMAILLVPTCQAIVVQTIPNQDIQGEYEGGGDLPNQLGFQTYTFSLPNPPLNYSAPSTANDSIVRSSLTGGIGGNLNVGDQPIKISQTTHFAITFLYNTTESIKLSADYTKHGWGSLAYWSPFYTIENNGTVICTTAGVPQELVNDFNQSLSDSIINAPGTIVDYVKAGFNLIGNSIKVTPTGRIYAMNDVIQDANGNLVTTITNTTTVGNSKLVYSIYDGYLVGHCANAATGLEAVNFTSLTAPPTIIIETNYPNPVTHYVQGLFANRTATSNVLLQYSNLISNAFGTITSPLNCGDGVLLGILCLSKAVALSIGSLAFGLITTVMNMILSWIPFGDQIRSVLIVPISLGWEITSTLFTIYFTNGPGYPPGGVWIAMLVWSASMGTVAAGLTGDGSWLWRFPVGYLKISTLGVLVAFYYVFWVVPKAAIEFGFNMLRVLRG